MEKLPVLILCPPPDERGGVADYYRLVGKYFRSDRVAIDFHYTGKRGAKSVFNNRLFRFVKDLLTLMRALAPCRLVVLNPSLDPKAVVRDGVYHFIAKRLYGKKTLVFFHGWDPGFERAISARASGLFRSVFNFDRGLLLATQFKETMVGWGYPPDAITVETTIYEAFDAECDRDLRSIVFLSRFEPGKGCLEAIQAVEIAARDFEGIRLFMVGDGSLAPELKEYVAARGLSGTVTFTGWLEGAAKYRLLKSCGIMLYPTSYGEGMPIALLEGMGMGLVVVTRPVAGIRDIIEDGRNGLLIESNEPEEFARRLGLLLSDGGAREGLARSGTREAEERFEIRNVARRLERIYYETGQ